MITKEFLVEQYINQKKSTNLIGKEIGSSSGDVYYYLKKYGIKLRDKSTLMMGNTNSKDRVVTEKTRKLLSKIHKGKSKSEEHKKKCSLAQIKRFKDNPEHGEHLRKIRLGIKMSTEQKEKISKSVLKNNKVKHHIFGKEYNDLIDLTRSKHMSLHHSAYFYILDKHGKEGILDYLNWFDTKHGLGENYGV